MDKHDKPDELQHHGVKGMKWGVRRTPEQLGHNPPAKKKKKKQPDMIDKFRAKIAASNKEREAQKAAKLKAEKEKAAADLAAKKEKILNSRDARLIYQNAALFTNDELKTAAERFRLEADVARYSKESPSVKDFVDKAVGYGKTANNVITEGTNLYDNVAKIVNAFSNENLPLIKDNSSKKNDDDDDSNNNTKSKNNKKNNRDTTNNNKGNGPVQNNKPKNDGGKNDNSGNSKNKKSDSKKKFTFEDAAKTVNDATNTVNSAKGFYDTVSGVVKSFVPKKGNKTEKQPTNNIIIDMDTTDLVSTSVYSSGKSFVEDAFSSGGTWSGVVGSAGTYTVSSFVDAGSDWIQETFFDD